MTWISWIGKPHVLGADPAQDQGCDCLVMVTRVREWLGLAAPREADIKELLLLASQHEYSKLKKTLEPHLRKLDHPKEGAFTLFEPPDQIGTAVVVDGGLLHVSHRHGVRWLPTSAVKKLQWYDWE